MSARSTNKIIILGCLLNKGHGYFIFISLFCIILCDENTEIETQGINILMERPSIMLLYDKCLSHNLIQIWGIKEDFQEEVTVELSLEGRIGVT